MRDLPQLTNEKPYPQYDADMLGAAATSPHGELYRYWDEVRGDRVAPMRADFEPTRVVNLLPILGLVERRPDGYFWRLMGTAIAEHFGRDMTGEQYGSHTSPAEFVAEMIVTFDAALERQTPFFDEFVYRSPNGQQQAVSRLVCPLGADDKHPPMVVHSRLHIISKEALVLAASIDQAAGKLLNRWAISSVEEIDRLAEQWAAKAASLVRDNLRWSLLMAS